jgi:hypothetical protein
MLAFCAQDVPWRASSGEGDGCNGNPLTEGGGTAYSLVQTARMRLVEAMSWMLELADPTQTRRRDSGIVVSHAMFRI